MVSLQQGKPQHMVKFSLLPRTLFLYIYKQAISQNHYQLYIRAMHATRQWNARYMSISCARQMRGEAQQVLRTFFLELRRRETPNNTTPPLSQSGSKCVCREQARLNLCKLPHLVGRTTGLQICAWQISQTLLILLKHAKKKNATGNPH